jgi:hypothetical protein
MPARTAGARALLCGGPAVLVVGTFLPWLRSGRTERNSYATDGAVRRLLDVDGLTAAALRAWPFVSLLCAAAIALVLLGRVGIGALLAALAALAAGPLAAWALGAPNRGLLHAAAAGPAVTLIGAVLTGLGVLACASGRLLGRDRS